MTQAWRQLTVKILNLKGSLASPNIHEEKDNVGSLAPVRELYYRRLASKILDEGSHLIKDSHDKSRTLRVEELIQMIRASGEVSALLWAQKAHMTPSKVDIGGKFLFNNDSPSIKAHSCMCLDSMDCQYNGRDVMLVIEPALFASGDMDDKTTRVWMPAIGWFSHESLDGTKANAASPTEGTCDTTTEAKRSQDVVGSQLERPTKRSKHGHLFETESGPQEALPCPKATEAVDRIATLETLTNNAEEEASSSTLPIDSSFSPIQENQIPVDSRPAIEHRIPSAGEDGLFHKLPPAYATSESSRRQDGQTKTRQGSQRTNSSMEGEYRALKGGEEVEEMQVDEPVR